MSFLTHKKRASFLFFGVLLVPVLFLFQNCGSKSFSAKVETTQDSVQDIDTEQPTLPEEPINPDVPLKSALVKMDRDIQEERPTHVVLVLDDSTSNAVNIPSMLKGVKDIIAKFEGKKFQITVYTTGNSPLDKVDFSVGKYVSDTKKEYPNSVDYKQTDTKNFVTNAALAEFDSNNPDTLNSFFAKVEDYFKKVQASTKIMADSYPNYHCQLLSYFKTLSMKPNVNETKHIVLVSSDENTKFTDTVCLEKEVVTQLKTFKGEYKTTAATKARPYVEVPMEKKAVMEGGVEVWSGLAQKFYDVTCADNVSSRVSSHIARYPEYRLTSRGLVCVDKIQAAAPEKKDKIYSPVSENKESVPMFGGTSYQQQVLNMQKGFNKGLLFFGTFTIRAANEIANADQEIGADHLKYASLYAAATNIGNYGVTQGNYDDFVDEVFVFDLITSNNFFSLADYNLGNAIVKAVKLVKYQGMVMNKDLPFTQTTTSITVNDPSINLDEGCELSIQYQEK